MEIEYIFDGCISCFYKYMILYKYTALQDEGCMDRELSTQVMIERVEMIARLTAEGSCLERDREIALNLIAEIAQDNLMKNNYYSVVFSASSVDATIAKARKVKYQAG